MVKCLPHKHEDTSSNPLQAYKSHMWWHVPVIPVLREGKQGCVVSIKFTELVCLDKLMGSGFSKRDAWPRKIK